MIRARYRGQQGSAWRSMGDTDVWLFQADTAAHAQPVLESELRIESKSLPCERPVAEELIFSLRLVIYVIALLTLLVFLLNEGWTVAARVAAGVFIGWALGWTQQKERER